MSHYDYYGRSSKPSHTGGDSHNGSFEQGRTTLPPLTITFPTSDSPVSGNHSSPHPTQHRPHGQNPHVVGDDQRGGHWEGVPQPVANAAMQGGMQYPPQIDAPNNNVAHYPPPPLPYPEVPHVYMHRDAEGAEVVPGQAYPFAPEVQNNHDDFYGYGRAQLHAADPPEAPPEVFPAVQHVQAHAAPPADMPPADGLRNLASRFLNNPDALVNMLRIEPGPDGRFVVWIALELADI